MRVRTILKAGGLVPVALAAMLATASPASATSFNLTIVDVAQSDTAPTGPSVTAACTLDGGAVTGPGVTFVVSGSATASGGVALATHVHCVVRTSTGSWGGPSGDLVGPYAAAAGLSQEIPFGHLTGVRVCAYGSAFFQGGIVKTTKSSSNC